MKKLQTFSPWERPQAELLRELLEREGIPCLLRNAELSAALGEIPFTECYPELWVIDEETWPRASSLLAQWLAESERPATPWVCPGCDERLEGQFGACWKCGRQRE